MRYCKTQKTFKSQRCEFNIETMEAWSYNWWLFVACLNGTVYFNGASYSMQTRKQQNIVEDLLKTLGIKYKSVYIKAGLQAIDKEIIDVQATIKKLKEDIARPLSRPKTNAYRKQSIKHLESELVSLKKMLKLRRTSYKGKVNLGNLPKPEKKPVSPVRQFNQRVKTWVNEQPEVTMQLIIGGKQD